MSDGIRLYQFKPQTVAARPIGDQMQVLLPDGGTRFMGRDEFAALFEPCANGTPVSTPRTLSTPDLQQIAPTKQTKAVGATSTKARPKRMGMSPQYDWERGYQMWKDGKSQPQVAKALGCKPSSVGNYAPKWKARRAQEQAGGVTVTCPEFTCQQLTRTSPCEHCHTSLPAELVNHLNAAKRS